MRIVVSFYLLLFLMVSSFAQSPPPPPVAKTTTVQLKDPFESKEGGFKVAFPAKPLINSNDIDGSFGKTKMYNYVLPTAFAEYLVLHMDFPTVLNDKVDLDLRFDTIRDSQVKGLGGRITNEVEIQFGSYHGRQFVAETPTSTVTTRCIGVEHRLFVITVTTRGNLSKQSATLRAANEGRINKFFDSFVVTGVGKAAFTQVELPADFGIQVTGQKFYSKFLDVSFDLPTGWSVLDDDENEMIKELGKESLERTKPNLGEYLNANRAKILVSVSKEKLSTGVNSATLIVAAERAQYPNFLPMFMAKTFVKMFLDPTEKVVKEPSLQTIGGLEFAWLETFDTSTKVMQRMYFANRNGIAFEFVLSFNDRKDLDPMLSTVNSLKIDLSKVSK